MQWWSIRMICRRLGLHPDYPMCPSLSKPHSSESRKRWNEQAFTYGAPLQAAPNRKKSDTAYTSSQDPLGLSLKQRGMDGNGLIGLVPALWAVLVWLPLHPCRWSLDTASSSLSGCAAEDTEYKVVNLSVNGRGDSMHMVRGMLSHAFRPRIDIATTQPPRYHWLHSVHDIMIQH